MNVKKRKSVILILALAMVLSVFVLPAPLVRAQTMNIEGPASASIGQTFSVTVSISPAVSIADFSVNVNFDGAGLQYNGYTALVQGMQSSVNVGDDVVVLGYTGGSTSASDLYTLTFTVLSAGPWIISVGDAQYGGGVAAGGDNVSVQVPAAGQPIVNRAAAQLPTIGPTPMGTVPAVKLAPTSTEETEPKLNDPETGEPVLTLFSFDGRRLVPAEADMPAELYVFDYEREVTVIDGTNVQVLRADGRPPLYYLETEDGEAGLYLHWQTDDRYLPYRLLDPAGARFVIMPPPAVVDLPDDFVPVELEIEGDIFPAFQPESTRYRLIGSETEADAANLFVVYARIQREPEDVLPEGEETLPAETTPDGLPVETEEGEAEETEPAEEAEIWEDGEFYFYDQTRNMLFPLSLMLLQIPEITPTPTLAPTPTSEPTETVPVETIPVDAEPVISLFGYEYGLWKAIIFVLGFLLLLTWLILLIRSLGKKSREVERERRLELARRQAMLRGRDLMHDERNRGDLPLHFDERPKTPEPNLVVPASKPLTVDEDEEPADKEPDHSYQPKRTRPDKLPEMPTLSEPRPAPLPPVRNAKRTHADEMVIRPLPTEPEPDPEPPATESKAVPERPVIRRVEIESRKPKIRRPDKPVINDQDNSEI